MKLFRQKSGSIADLERELAALRQKRDGLQTRLSGAEFAVEQAVADRRARLVESDTDDEAPDRVAAARERRDAITDGLDEIDQRVAAAVARLDAEKDRQARKAEGESRQRQIAQAKEALTEFITRSEALVSALQPLAPVAIETGACGANVQLLSRQLAIDVEVGLREASSYVERVLAGGEPIRSEPTPIEPPPPPPPPPPAIERRSVFLRYAGRWLEGDETKTSGAHTIVGLPVEVARAALEFNHAVPVDSQAAADLRAIMDPGYGVWPDRSVHRSNQAQAAAKAAGRTSNGRRVARA
jgi:hypothetical protein